MGHLVIQPGEEPEEPTGYDPDFLAEWLYERYYGRAQRGVGWNAAEWEALTDLDRTYWRQEAEAVLGAVRESTETIDKVIERALQ